VLWWRPYSQALPIPQAANSKFFKKMTSRFRLWKMKIIAAESKSCSGGWKSGSGRFPYVTLSEGEGQIALAEAIGALLRPQPQFQSRALPVSRWTESVWQ
jgi:hypothetical protein